MDRSKLLGLVAAVAGMMALLLFLFMGPFGESDTPTPPDKPVETSEETLTDPPTDPPTQYPADTTVSAGEQTLATPDESALKPDILPTFDVARVDGHGNLLVAGRSAPEAMVTVVDNGEAGEAVKADMSGEFVYLPDHPLEPGTHELRLTAINTPDGPVLEGEEVVVLDVPERGVDMAENALPPVKLGGADGSHVMAGLPEGAGDDALTIDTVDYDESGTIRVGGRTSPDAPVRLYLDNRLQGNTRGDDKGLWWVVPDVKLTQGRYLLRADRLNEKAEVVARVELPFEFAPFTDLPSGQESDGFRRRLVIVKPGNSLWRIAHRVYGSGFAYTTIFQANKNQIADPDLIYPGQVFDLPPKNTNPENN